MCITLGFIHIGAVMRTNIDIDDKLMEEAQRLSGLKTKRAVVDAALQMLVRVKGRRKILKLAGKGSIGRAISTRCVEDIDDPRR